MSNNTAYLTSFNEALIQPHLDVSHSSCALHLKRYRPPGLLVVHDCPQFRQSGYRLAVDLVNHVAREQLAGWTIGRHGEPGDQDAIRAARSFRQKCGD